MGQLSGSEGPSVFRRVVQQGAAAVGQDPRLLCRPVEVPLPSVGVIVAVHVDPLESEV